jgi:hypothetical protein
MRTYARYTELDHLQRIFMTASSTPAAAADVGHRATAAIGRICYARPPAGEPSRALGKRKAPVHAQTLGVGILIVPIT